MQKITAKFKIMYLDNHSSKIKNKREEEIKKNIKEAYRKSQEDIHEYGKESTQSTNQLIVGAAIESK